MGEQKRSEQSLAEKIFDLHSQMDEVKESMVQQGFPVVAIAWTDKVTLPAYEMLIRAQHNKTPIADIDEAIVASCASIIYDYLQRVHPMDELEQARAHFELIGQDVSERVVGLLQQEFKDVPKIIIPGKLN